MLTNGRIATKRKTLGQVLICVGCCCGRADRGRPSVPVDWLNLVRPNSMTWLGGLATAQEYEALLAWALRSTEAGALHPLPAQFAARVFKRFRAGEKRLAY
ncbi:MAG: hypothetical protein J2P52_18065 [Blastocatellia bacterium]|nr:hypothetical protein [Blastocatellia bacterium]